MDEYNSAVATCEKMLTYLQERTPFAYIRFADGECNCIDNPDIRTNLEQDYVPSLRKELHTCFCEMMLCRDENFLFGCANENIPADENIKNLGYWSKYFVEHGWDKVHPNLYVCQAMVTAIPSLIPLSILKELKGVVVVGNLHLHSLAIRRKWQHLAVPETHCWDTADVIYSRCKRFPENSIFLWCAGMASKPLAWRLWRELPTSTHLDMGHFFDAYANRPTRSWLCGTPDHRLNLFNSYYRPFLEA